MSDIILNTEILGNKTDKKICLALMTIFVILMTQYFFLIYFNFYESTNASSVRTLSADASRVQLISKIMVGFAFLSALPAVLRRSGRKFISVYITAFLVFLVHYLVFIENRPHIQGLAFTFFFTCLPALIYTLSIRDLNELKLMMKKAGCVIFLIGVLLGGLVFSGISSMGTYSMSYSYYMLLPTIMFIDELFTKFSLKIFLFMSISLLLILALGSRGPILCSIVFVIFRSIRSHSLINIKKLFIYLILFQFTAIGIIFFEEILTFINKFLLSMGIKSRSILLFLRDTIHLSSRETLYKNVLEKTLDNPFLGVGIGGDRAILEGAHVHNIFLELIANYGFLIGFTIIIIICLLLFKKMFSQNFIKYDLVIIWFSLGFVPLIISGSYLTDLKFWIFLGILFNGTFRFRVP